MILSKRCVTDGVGTAGKRRVAVIEPGNHRMVRRLLTISTLHSFQRQPRRQDRQCDQAKYPERSAAQQCIARVRTVIDTVCAQNSARTVHPMKRWIFSNILWNRARIGPSAETTMTVINTTIAALSVKCQARGRRMPLHHTVRRSFQTAENPNQIVPETVHPECSPPK